MSLRILFLSAEVAPFAKRGGLGDVGGSLPKALRALGHDVRVVMPAYQNIEQGYEGVEAMPASLTVPMGDGVYPAGAFQSTLPNSDVPIYFIAEKNLFNRPEVYGYNDDPYRFAFFSRAALDLMIAALQWRPDVVHAHDWHSAPAVTWLATSGQHDARYRDLPTVFTIHNLAHQGQTSRHIFEYMGLESAPLHEEGANGVNFMARGIYHATMVNTVSPTYAEEIMTPAGGANLDPLLRYRSFDVHGLLNGIDYDVWNPATDSRIPSHFDVENWATRIENKRALQAYLQLPQRDDVPLLAIISRLDWQKGLDLMEPMLHRLLQGAAGEAQFMVLGTGAQEYETMFARLAKQYPDKMTAVLQYNAGLAPLIYAGSDMFLMPSRFEPCGLGQLIAMRYGSVPIVRATGGLVDTVQDGVTGVVFHKQSADAFWTAVQRAMFVYHTDRATWRQIQRHGMGMDFSWSRSAHKYQQLYEWAMARIGD